ncbi:MAG TPA: bifunctional diaminohydroxyphosphoribosylaminopyrimidine deaminase/5-amino-6-(5-phosphoribosylamino)uracil reductase RibD [Bacillota bacterium]|nr:bifunctional diaminohydroxyphosphoribosylaminopyrimidine deaminase/5-amino-6-(5-phosphoribosylamino)uracil reductase RibD [Bacillota bacterium]HOP68838.1 bifunctional diaminohydroxyphosphoribosylaminopyrimidine deaminase/5-amino-6-(5-phosphoribosylamino)uracil reductase RibD [Bacillota bacterium]HPT34156.1 bifunctional diaminohydroxyphosphoribosylaminopyrimidine deaminase/5-amino-6-(5-phosphoribosylamino)uracil reductase RibD [Bacillota bacterium]HQD06658.1 bifunctional diaminohydroxyphosphor
MDVDERFMWMALDLARQGRGRTSPNPMVGAVLVKEEEVVGSGGHLAAGTPHAEIIALNKAGKRARGAVLYINLEPCCHHGRTPPCVEALIKAGVSKVVAAMEDPNPLVSGKGFQRLREAGIEVEVGLLEEQARRLNEAFIKYITTGIPFVMVKAAMTLDGKIATRTGESRWITGEKARQFVHRLRDQVDAVIVGIETVLRDDPRLTTRLEGGGGKDAARVVVDSRGRLPLEARVINRSSPAPTILATTEQASPDKCALLKERGVEVLLLPEEKGRVDLKALLQALGKREMTSVLVEGGGTLNYAFLERDLVDKLFLFVAPIICGGREAPTPFSGEGVASLKESWSLKDVELKQFHQDLLIIGYPGR